MFGCVSKQIIIPASAATRDLLEVLFLKWLSEPQEGIQVSSK